MGKTPKSAAEIAEGVTQKLAAKKTPAPKAKAPATKAAKKPVRVPRTQGIPKEMTEDDEAVELSQATTLDPDNPRHSRIVRFIDAYMIKPVGTQAALAAGYAKSSAQQTATRLMSNALVKSIISKRMRERAESMGLEADSVYKAAYALAHHDANELIEHCLDACRYCWGTDNKYQFKPSEFAERERQYNIECAEAAAVGEDMPEFDPLGGVGFNPKLGPNPECQECFGDGISRIFMKDSRHLSPAARVAYGGMKITKEGVEMKVYDKTKGLDMLARHEGFYNDKLDLNLGQQMTNDQLDAIYDRAQANAGEGKTLIEERAELLEGGQD